MTLDVIDAITPAAVGRLSINGGQGVRVAAAAVSSGAGWARTLAELGDDLAEVTSTDELVNAGLLNSSSRFVIRWRRAIHAKSV